MFQILVVSIDPSLSFFLDASPGKVRLELMYPIHVAAQMGDVPILRILLDLGVDPQTGAADGRTARHFVEEANRDGSHSRILQLLAHSQRVKSVAL